MNKKVWVVILCMTELLCYDLPVTLNFGYSNILEGGPTRPTYGWYWYQYLEYYNSHKFLNNFGKLLNGVPSPTFNGFFGATEFIYQTKDDILLNAKLGLDLVLYYSFYSKISKNSIGLTDNGTGFSDPYLGLFLQWNPIMRGERPIFVHRLEFGASFPAGKYNKNYFFNPGSGFFWINPSWAYTLYFTPRWALSGHFNYVWSAKNRHTNIQAGQALCINYSMEIEPINHLWLAVNGYYIKQFTDSKINGIKVPGRREQVFSIGPGALYTPNNNLYFFAHLYFENFVKNRAQGIEFLLRWVVHF